MEKFKLIELAMDYKNKRDIISYYGNFKYIKKLGNYVSGGYSAFHMTYFKIKEPVYKYLSENKDKYLFIKSNYNYMTIVDKEYTLSNMNGLYAVCNKNLFRFVKYHLIKERLYGKF